MGGHQLTLKSVANAVKYLNSGVTEALGFHFVSLIQLAHVELSNLRHLFCLSFYFKTLRYKKNTEFQKDILTLLTGPYG